MEATENRHTLTFRYGKTCQVQLRGAPDGADGETFVVASTNPGERTATAARDAYEQIAALLADEGLEILHERVFASRSVSGEVLDARRSALSEAGLPHAGALTYIEGHPTWGEGMAGVIVRCIRRNRPGGLRTLYDGDQACGRAWESQGATFLMLQNIHGLAPEPGADNDRLAQTRRMIERAERILREQGATFREVARTWFYLSRILDWYDAFNRVRTERYRAYRLMPEPGAQEILLPASTGISGENLQGAAAVLDLLAVATGKDTGLAVRQMTNRRQLDAVRYGSAFSRGALIRSCGHSAVQVSGTAAIDGHGRSLYPGDVHAQIACTLDTIEGLLEPTGCRLGDIAAATVFLKNPQDAPVFERMAVQRGLEPFPAVTVVADICRSELLFEIDAEAVCGRPPEGTAR